jgi:DNA invertase Pin-like site-specific DNA recombinase
MKAKPIDRAISTRAATDVLIPAFAYARVSSKEQEREGYSIPVQLKRIHEYAQRHGFTIVEEFVDVETAKEPGRREFSRMVEAARHDATVGAIICEKVDRLCRNLRDYLTIDELPAKTLFWQQDFPDNAAGKLSFGMMVLLAKHYIDNLSDEVKKGMAEKVQEGGFPHQAPLGYRNVREGDRQIIVPDPLKAPMVRRAYELYASRAYSLKTLRKKLRDEGLAMTKHSKLISLSQLEWLLKNPFYYGAFRWKGRVWAGSHHALVSRELWDAVQAAFSAHEKPVYRKHDFAYKGLLICGSCGRHLTAEIKKKRYVYYHCAGDEACRKTYIREEQLDDQVRTLLASIAIPDEAKTWLMQGIAKSREEQRAYHQTVVQEIRTEIKEQEALMDRLYDDRLHRLISEDFFRQRWDRLEEKRQQLSRDLAKHQHAEGAYMELGSKLIELIAQAPQIFERADPEQRRELVGLLTSNRVLRGRTLEFELRKPFDALVSAANHENGWPTWKRTPISPST